MNSFTPHEFTSVNKPSKQQSKTKLSILSFMAILMLFMASFSNAQTTLNFPGGGTGTYTIGQGAVPWLPNIAYPVNQLVYYNGYLYKVTSVASGSFGFSGTIAPNVTTVGSTFTCSTGTTVQGQAYTSSYATLTVQSALTTSGTWVCPSGVYAVQVEAWGAGGGGGSLYGWFTTTGGGAGGSYVKYTVPVVPGQTYYYTIGLGGAPGTYGSKVANDASAGGFTYFGKVAAGASSFATLGSASTTLVLAGGGAGAIASNEASKTGLSSSLYANGGSSNATGSKSGDIPLANATAGNTGSTANLPALPSGTTSSGHNTGSGGNGIAGTNTTAGTGGITFGTKGASQDGNGQGFNGAGVGSGGSGATCGNFNTGNSVSSANFYQGGSGTNGQMVLTFNPAPTGNCTTSNAFASLPYSTSFETAWGTDCNTTSSNDLPDTYWGAGYNNNGGTANANNFWHRSDYTGSDWTSPQTDPFAGVNRFTVGSYCARFNNSGSPANTQGILDLRVNVPSSSVNGVTLSFDYINPNGLNSLQVLVSSDGGTTFSTSVDNLNTIQATWKSKTYTINATGNLIIRFLATSSIAGGTYDIGLDNLSVYTPPTISLSTSSLTANNYSYVSAGPATANTFTVAGIGLVGSNLSLSANADDDYEFSLTGTAGSFVSASSLSIPFTAPTLSATTVYVRLKASKSAGTYNETYSVTGGTASAQTITITASVTTTPSITLPGKGSVNSYTVGYGPATASTFLLSADYLTAAGYLTFSGAADYEFSVDNINFYSATNFTAQNFSQVQISGSAVAATTIYVRLKVGLTASSSSYNNESLTVSGGNASPTAIVLSGSVFTPTLTTSVSSFTASSVASGSTPTGTYFTTSATNLAAGNLATVSVAGNFVWSLTNGSFSNNTTTLTSLGSNFTNQTIYVALATGLSAGYYTGTLTITGSGITRTIALGGAVTSNNFVPGNIVALASSSGKDVGTSVIEVYPNLTAQSTPVSTTNIVPGTDGGQYFELYSAQTNTMYLSNNNDGSLICFTGAISPSDNYSTQPTAGILTRAVATMGNSLTVAQPVNLIPYTGGTTGSTNNYNAATTIDNTNYFIAQGNGNYTANASANSGPFSTTNINVVKAFGGVVYASSSATAIGTLSSTTASSISSLPGNPTFSSVNDFALISSGNNGTGVYDVLYTIGTSVNKYALVSGSWVAKGSYTFAAQGSALCASTIAGGGANLYTSTGSGTNTANSIVQLIDNAAWNATINISATNTLYTAPAGIIVKGVAFAPLVAQTTVAIPTSITYGDNGNAIVLPTTTNANQSISYTVVSTTPATGVATLSGNTITVSGIGTITINASAVATGNYAPLYQTYTITVNAKTITITGASANDKVYDGTTTASITGGSLSGVIASDVANVSIVSTSVIANFTSANKGNNQSVTVSGFTLSGSAAGNYTLTQPNGLTANITAASLTITGVVIATKQYNAGNPTDVTATVTNYGSLAGVVAADAGNVTLNHSSVIATFADPNPGTWAVSFTGYVITGSAISNYTLSQPTGVTGVITNLQPQTVSFNPPASVTYSSTTIDLSAYTTASSGLTSFTYSSSNTSVATVSGNILSLKGVGSVTITANQAGGGSYAAASNTASISVGVATLTVTGVSIVSKQYNNSTAATLTGTATLSGIINSDAVTITGTPTATFASVNVANGITVTVTGYTLGGAKASNYVLTQPSLTGNITQASQTITFGALNSIYTTTAPYSVTATASSALAVTFTSSDPTVATVSSAGLVTPLKGGTTIITAAQVGNANYAAASSVAQTLSVNTAFLTFDFTQVPADYTTPANRETYTSGGTTYHIRTSTLTGATLDDFTLSPAGVTAGTLTYKTGTNAYFALQAYASGISSNSLSTLMNTTDYIQTSVVLPTGKVFSNNALSMAISSWCSSAANKKAYATYYKYSTDATGIPNTAITTATGNVTPTGTNVNGSITTGDIVLEVPTTTPNTNNTTIPAPGNTDNAVLTLQIRLWGSNVSGNWRMSSFKLASALAQANAIIDAPSFTVNGSAVAYNSNPVGFTASSVSYIYNGTAHAPVITAAAGSTSYTSSMTVTNYTGTGSTTYNSTTAPTAVGTYSVTVTIASSATNAFTKMTVPFDISPSAYTWVGGTAAHTTDWNTATNWAGGNVPTATSDVTILPGTTYFPVLTATSNCRDLYIEGGTVSLNGQALTIAGQVYGAGLLIGSSSATLNMNSSTANTLNFRTTNSTDTLLGSLVISGTGKVKLGSNIGITTLLNLNNSATALDINGHHLTLKSNATKTAEFAPITGNAAIFDGAQAAPYTATNITVERYIPQGKRNYRDLAPSVANAGSVFANWQENGAGSPTSSNGVYITGKTGTPGYAAFDATTGFDLTTNGNSTPSLYSCVSGNWTAVTTTTGGTKAFGLNPFQGLRVLVRGARNFNMGTNPTNMPTATTLRATGTLITGTVTYNAIGNGGTVSSAYTSSYGLTPQSAYTSGEGWSFVANPYACPVSWSAILANTGTNVGNTYYFLDPTYQNTGVSRYTTVQYNGSTTVVNRPSGVSTDAACLNIQPGQGFWVYHTVTTPKLVIQESNKVVAGTQTAVFRTAKPNMLNVSIWKEVDGVSTHMDEAVATFNNNYSKAIGAEDAKKLMNGSENISIVESNTDLSINGIALPTVGEEIALRVGNVTANTTYQLKVDATEFAAPGVEAFIKDAYLNTVVPAETVVNFTPTSDAVTYKDRFSIVFKSAKVVPVATTGKGSITVYPNPVTEKAFTIQTANVAAGKYNVVLVNSVGQEVMNTIINHVQGSSNETIKLNKLMTGMYTVVLSSTDGKVKYTTELLAK